MRFRDIHLFDERVVSDYLTRKGTSTQCTYDTLPFVDGFRWSSLKTVAGLRVRSGRLEITGGTPTVDDRVDGQLTVRWPTRSPEGALILTFNERMVSIQGEALTKDNWYLELSSDETAALPFDRIDGQKISCTFKRARYAVSATQGTFTRDSGSGLRIMPEAGRLVLDFSAR
jgi:hypothetical protein